MSYNGCCFFAYNNEQIDYVKLAMLSALYVKKFMKHNNTCLITSQGDWEWLKQSQPADVVDRAFDEVVFTNVEHKPNVRVHHDSPWTKFESHFKNSNKYLVNEYSPFDKTLLLDIDYIVRNDSLDYLFEQEDIHVGMFDKACDLRTDPPHMYEQYLNPVGIPTWWSTVVYFDKSEESKMFFDMWAHITEEYDFYKFLYSFPGKMYRTDYCVSVASHILNGMTDGDHIHKIIYEQMKYMDQKDDIVEVVSADDWIFLVNDRKENWKDILTRNLRENIHVMNKRSLDRNYNELIGAVL